MFNSKYQFHFDVIDSVFYPFYKGLFFIQDKLGSVFYKYIYLVDIQKENIKLKKEIENLKIKIAVLESDEVRELYRLLKIKRNLKYKAILSKVIAYDIVNMFSSFKIDKGREDGIKLNMLVVNPPFVIGKIYKVNSKTSSVVSIAKPGFTIPALIQKKNIICILKSVGLGKANLMYIPHVYKDDINIGDIVYWPGIDSFKAKFILGKVKSFQREGIITIMADVETFKDLSLSYVFVVANDE